MAIHVTDTNPIVNDELRMSIRIFIVAFDAVATRFWEGSYFTLFDFESAWLMIVVIFSSTGPISNAWRTYTCRLLGKRERQEVMVRCFFCPTLKCNLSKSVFLCPYFILDVFHPPVFPLRPPYSSHKCSLVLFTGI